MSRRRRIGATLFAFAFLLGAQAIGLCRVSLHIVAPAAKPPVQPTKPRIPTAADVYNRSLVADTLYSYRGHQVTTYWRTGRAIRVLIKHMAPNWRRIDFLAPDRLRGDILVSNGSKELRYDASTKTLHSHVVAANKPSDSDVPVKYEQLRANYILSFLPRPQIYSDRKCFVLSITRKNNRTLARRLWIDAATGLVLKREGYSETGKLNVSVAYTDINFHPKLTKADFTLPAGKSTANAVAKTAAVHEADQSEKPVSVANAPKMLDGKAFAPRGVDEFRLTSAAAVMRAGKNPVLHLRYSDGLMLVSVFEQQRTHTNRPTRVPPSMKTVMIGKTAGHMARHASLVTLNWDTPTLNMTMIGEISAARMLDLAEDFGNPAKIHR
jgi:outer membrane lipoprotein-sorting protein